MDSKVVQNDVSDEIEAKKKKNSEAAKRSRRLKQKKTQELKEKNEELENENKILAEQKNELERTAWEYQLMICHHRKKGCKLPPEFETLWNQEIENENVTFTETHNVVTLPESSSVYTESTQNNFIEKPPLHRDESNESTVSVVGPTALFSGTPLLSKPSAQTKTVRLSTSSSSSGSSPPKVTLPSISRPRAYLRSTSHEISETLMPSTSSNQRLGGSNMFPVVSFEEPEKDIEANGMEDADNDIEDNAVAVSYALNNHSIIGIQSSQDYGNQYEYTAPLGNEETDQGEQSFYTTVKEDMFPNDFLVDGAQLINKNPEEYQTHKTGETPVSSQFQQLNVQQQHLRQLGTTAATNRGSRSDQFSNMRLIPCVYVDSGSVQADMSHISVSPALQNCPGNELLYNEANQDQLGLTVLPAVPSFQGLQQGIQGQLYNNHGSQYNNHDVNSSNVATAIGLAPKRTATKNGLLSPVAGTRSHQHVPDLINILPSNSSPHFTQHQHYISASNVSNNEIPNDCSETDMSAQLSINNLSIASTVVTTPTVAPAVAPTTTFHQSVIEEPHSGTLRSCEFREILELPSFPFLE